MLQEIHLDKKRIIKEFLDKGILLSPGFFQGFHESSLLLIFEALSKIKNRPLVLNEDLLLIIKDNELNHEINWLEFDRSRVMIERGLESKNYYLFLDIMNYHLSEEKKKILEEVFQEPSDDMGVEEEQGGKSGLIVLQNYQEHEKKREVQDFVQHFRI